MSGLHGRTCTCCQPDSHQTSCLCRHVMHMPISIVIPERTQLVADVSRDFWVCLGIHSLLDIALHEHLVSCVFKQNITRSQCLLHLDLHKLGRRNRLAISFQNLHQLDSSAFVPEAEQKTP